MLMQPQLTTHLRLPQARLHGSTHRIPRDALEASHSHARQKLRPDSLRYASTNTKPIPVADVQPTFIPDTSSPTYGATASFPASGPVSELDSFGDIISEPVQRPTYEYIGWLHDIGVDFGWGPTSVTQFILEHIHVWGGFPWWASIGLTVLTVRTVLFKLYMNASDNAARLAAINPLLEPITARMKAAQKARDQQAMLKATQDRSSLMRDAGASTMTSLWPILFQIPMGIGMFRLMNGMSALPVPGFEEGGFLWLSDLSVRDPLYIMPALTVLIFHFTFKMGGEAGANTTMSPATTKIFSYLLPAISGIFAMWWPAGLQLPMLITGLLSMVQAYVFKQAWFRTFFKMQPHLARKARPSGYNGTINVGEEGSEKKGLMEGMKQIYQDVVKQGEAMRGQTSQPAPGQRKPATRQSDTEARQAREYEAKRAREAAQHRFEAQQTKMAAAEERRARKARL